MEKSSHKMSRDTQDLLFPLRWPVQLHHLKKNRNKDVFFFLPHTRSKRNVSVGVGILSMSLSRCQDSLHALLSLQTWETSPAFNPQLLKTTASTRLFCAVSGRTSQSPALNPSVLFWSAAVNKCTGNFAGMFHISWQRGHLSCPRLWPALESCSQEVTGGLSLSSTVHLMRNSPTCCPIPVWQPMGTITILTRTFLWLINQRQPIVECTSNPLITSKGLESLFLYMKFHNSKKTRLVWWSKPNQTHMRLM